MTCKICFERNVKVAFLKCGHISCKECFMSLVDNYHQDLHNDGQAMLTSHEYDAIKCPFCKTPIHNKVELFFP
jgi:hypothetical protein